MTTKTKIGRGRPSSFNPIYCDQAYKLCLLGATDKQLADFFDVAEATINNWKLDHPEFLESLKKGKIVADSNVAEALYERAKGYKHPDAHISNYQGEITITPITKYYPPDTAAAFIWLKNRAGWKDKQELEHGGSVDNNWTVTIIRPEGDSEN
jgi:hypothetical protein